MLNDPSNQMIGSSSNPANDPGSSSNPNTQTPYFPTFSQQNPYMNPDDFAFIFLNGKMQTKNNINISQQQQKQNESQPRSSNNPSQLVDETKDDEEERAGGEDEDEAPKRARSLWTDGEELLLAETYIQVSEDPKEGPREHFGPEALPGRTGSTDPKREPNLERKMKQDVLERESRARVDLLESQKIAEDMPGFLNVPPGEIILGLCKATEVVMNKCFYLLGIAPDPSLAHFNHRAFLSYVDRPVKEVGGLLILI
ncbi:hypothetical protein Tco_1038410 [Tanacetum coccineum]